MATDYAQLRADNIRRYGEDIARIGPMLLAQRYDNRAHFIFELLQNAEDALRRRPAAGKVREVTFTLTPDALIFSHFGQPFTSEDVQFICGIGESTGAHGITDIGRFGIGFKSVYSFTARPEIHSGDEHFAIEDYVHPCTIDQLLTEPGQTVFRFPFHLDDTSAYAEIHQGLSQLDLTTLLFLREIEQVKWETSGGAGGIYLRDPKSINDTTREVVIIGSVTGHPDIQEATYLVVTRPVANDDRPAGCVEIAYKLVAGRVQPIENATLSVFFPTIVPTRFGALLQGPFRTTPSRDNIPRDNPWNKHLVAELASLLGDSLETLRVLGKLDAQALHALPIHRARFTTDTLLSPLFEATLQTLKANALIPCVDGGHCAANAVRLGRTKEIRDLFSSSQLGALLGSASPVAWVTDAVTRDKTPQLREYLNTELKIQEMEAEAIVTRIDTAFLSAQPLDWLARFYEFLGNQESAWRTLRSAAKPIIRLQNGRHVPPFIGQEPQAYLPTSVATDFPTVHSELCRNTVAKDFLKKIGIGPPDVVDDVIKNLLPRYRTPNYCPPDSIYTTDLARIHAAFNTDSSEKKKRLIDQLRAVPFAFAIEAAPGRTRYIRPSECYIPTERLRNLLADLAGVWLADMTKGGQLYEAQHDLLRACGANEYLLPVEIPSRFTPQQLCEMRREEGTVSSSRQEVVIDYTLRDLDKLLKLLPLLSPERAKQRAKLLWEALGDVETQRAKTYFSGQYSWFYNKNHYASFDAAFIVRLRETAWIPKSDDSLGRPSEVVFESLAPAWVANPFLLSLIPFKPRAEVQLAQLAGIEPGVIDLLKSRGITSEKQLIELLGLKQEPAPSSTPLPVSPADAVNALLGETLPPSAPVGGCTDEYAPGAGRQGGTHSGGGAAKSGTGTSTHSGPRAGGGGGSSGGHAGPSHANPESYRPTFHTYVAASPDDVPVDPEGLDQAARMQIEQAAITFIRTQEPALQTTPPGNPGFDLFEGADPAQATRFVEVKSRSGAWSGPVALSREQFLKAQAEGDRFWLYVVENTRDPSAIKTHRIQNPAGLARHFSFDPGWRALSVPASI